MARALTGGLEEKTRGGKTHLALKLKSLVSLSVGQLGKKPKAAYNSEQQMTMKGRPSGGAK